MDAFGWGVIVDYIQEMGHKTARFFPSGRFLSLLRPSKNVKVVSRS